MTAGAEFYTTGLRGDTSQGKVRTGLRQGCPLSPYLCIIMMSVLFHVLDERLVTSGIPTNNWSMGKPTYDLEYADDTLLFGVTTRALQEYLQHLQAEASLYGMELNLQKTEFLTDPSHLATPPAFNCGDAVNNKTQCRYLGSDVTWTKPTLTALSNRQIPAHAAYCQLMPICGSKIPKAAKIHIYHSVVVSTSTYGICTLTMEDKHLQKLDSWYFSYLHRVVGVPASYYSRISNKTVWESVDQPTLPSQLVLSQQFQVLVGSVQAPSSSPLHHVIFFLSRIETQIMK